MKVVDSWDVVEDEEFSLTAGNEDKAERVMVSGVKKTDIENFDIVKKAMKEDMISDDEFQIEETIKEEPYQTTHYTGELYSFIGNTEGVKAEVRFYYLETETEYVVLNFIGLPSFFEKNGDIVTEMLNSFVVG
ncbi:hypothetical protein IGI39_004581 [Enterococcus sp. AZ135]|uniref:hypothetical protein n=1 Tax=unclassified Enterococcus TaxID=2608891 RepID=UPI003F27B5C8